MDRFTKIFIILIFVWPCLTFAQKPGKLPPVPPRTVQPDMAGVTEMLPVINILSKGGTAGLDCDPFPQDSVWMDFSIDWTNYQMHRVSEDSPIEIILPGTISGSNTLYWNLSSAAPNPGGLPNLQFVENIFGSSGPAYGSDIPLTWEISVDGGSFQPMTLLPDNTLTATFTPGPHTFEVRITGNLTACQSDGYYQLQLSQSIVPEL